jgi:hypothetical protein
MLVSDAHQSRLPWGFDTLYDYGFVIQTLCQCSRLPTTKLPTTKPSPKYTGFECTPASSFHPLWIQCKKDTSLGARWIQDSNPEWDLSVMVTMTGHYHGYLTISTDRKLSLSDIRGPRRISVGEYDEEKSKSQAHHKINENK